MRVLLVEPWFGGSHRQWAEGYARHSEHDVELLTLPDEGWKWRLRGAALTLAGQVSTTPDVVLASSMLDVATFVGHARHHVHRAPVALYMHENQLTYPLADGVSRDTSLALVNWNSMAAADSIIFNSAYHRAVWFEALTPLLRSFPPPRHDGLIDRVRARSHVLPVGVDLDRLRTPLVKQGPPLVLWNQRWEHDKNPTVIAEILTTLAGTHCDFRVALCGESPVGEVPPVFDTLVAVLGARLEHIGFAEQPQYQQILHDSAIVLSAADHEFFGVAVVEAMAAGAIPVLPDRLAYPEIVGPDLRSTLYASTDDAVAQVVELLSDASLRSGRSAAASAAAHRFDWESVAPRYDAMLSEMALRAG
ncbi:MAG: DUF3524 domain-containing protein [Acidimicrobiia bacterium]|nr:DUF3524 domain-containing protein [Acidimicrobiia bacterium]